ncbi:MAG: flagellar FliJ protein [Oleiphilaceae bacterium]
MKKKSDRLKIVLGVAKRNEQKALDALAGKRRYRDQQQEQLDGLKSYYDQYMVTMKANMQEGAMSVLSLQTYQSFVSQIDQAREHQKSTVQIAQQEFDLALQNWTIYHQKHKGMTDLISRYKSEEEAVRDKKEQKQLEDDLTARRRQG